VRHRKRDGGAGTLTRRTRIGALRGCVALLALLALLAAARLTRDSGGWPGSSPITLPAAERARLRIDPNRASRAELALLPGIGQTLAARIVAFRELRPQPAFRAPADLAMIAGIGAVLVERAAPYLQCASATDSR